MPVMMAMMVPVMMMVIVAAAARILVLMGLVRVRCAGRFGLGDGTIGHGGSRRLSVCSNR